MSARVSPDLEASAAVERFRADGVRDPETGELVVALAPARRPPGRERRVRKRDVLIVLVLGALLAGLGALLVFGLREEPTTAPPETLAGTPVVQRSAGAFLDSVGVNVHVTYTDTSYGGIDAWLPRLRALGVRHVRDGLEPTSTLSEGRLQRLAADGIKLTLITSINRGAAEQASYARRTFGSGLEALEAPNELDGSGPKDWVPRLREFLPALRRAVPADADDAPTLIGPSFIGAGSWETVSDLGGNWDVDNLHPYPGGREPESNIAQQLGLARATGSKRPVQATETGYHNATDAKSGQPPVSEAAGAAYVPRMALSYFAAGMQRTFFYELLDQHSDPRRRQAEARFGLLHSDLTPKPAYVALRNTLDIVRRTTSVSGRRREVRVEGPSDVRSIVLTGSGRGSVVALWRQESLWDTGDRRSEDVEPVRARVYFQGHADDVEVRRPSEGTGTIDRRASATSLRVPVGGDVVLVSYR
jgi:hypothetical protein